MPELPEAETIVRELATALRGCQFDRVVVNRSDVVRGTNAPLHQLLSGRQVKGVARRGKRVLINLEPTGTLLFRLGMTGRLLCAAIDDPIEKHTHLRILLAGGSRELRFCDPRRFGGVWVHDGPYGASDGLGPDPLEIRLPEFRRVLNRRRQIKALLMDQGMIAGLGNIYCDESLHAAGVHPLRRADTFGREESLRLLQCIKRTLRVAIRFNGSTFMDYRRTDGSAGTFQDQHRVYQREGRPCRKCRATIVRIVAAGRSTFFCPKCQPTGE